MAIRSRHSPTDWLLLFALVVLWGSSFALNKIALTALPPLALVAYRLIIAAIVLTVAAYFLRHSLRLPWRHWRFFLLLALIGNCIPFFLISWGQVHIDSALAGILMAVMPLLTLLMSHFFLDEETFAVRGVLGFLLGFAGIGFLVGPEAFTRLGGENLLAQLAVLGGAVCYAINAVLARFNPDDRPVVTSAGVMIAAALVMTPLSLVGHPPASIHLTMQAVLAATALGLLGTAVATLVFFRLIASAGPTFLSLNNYLIPIWAVLVGALFLGERLGWNAYAALALILFGIGLSQLTGGADDKSRTNDLDSPSGP